MSHIEYTANGVLMIVFGFLVHELRLQSTALKIWFATLQIGTRPKGTAGLVGAFIGYSSTLMPTINEKFPAPHGSDHPAVTGLLQLCGATTAVRIICLPSMVCCDPKRRHQINYVESGRPAINQVGRGSRFKGRTIGREKKMRQALFRGAWQGSGLSGFFGFAQLEKPDKLDKLAWPPLPSHKALSIQQQSFDARRTNGPGRLLES